MLEYSKLSLPIHRTFSEEEKLKTCLKSELGTSWCSPKQSLVQECLKIAKMMQKNFPFWDVDGDAGLWIVKPGLSVQGNGVMTIKSAEQLTATAKIRSRVIQKYCERPLLLNLDQKSCSFTIKQWVLVTSVEPLTVYIFDSFMVRMETKEWTDKSELDLTTRLTHQNKHRYVSASFLEQ